MLYVASYGSHSIIGIPVPVNVLPASGPVVSMIS
jgi:hypothetical protein